MQFPQDLLTAHCPGLYLPVWLLGYEKYVQDGAGRPHLGEGSGPPGPHCSPVLWAGWSKTGRPAWVLEHKPFSSPRLRSLPKFWPLIILCWRVSGRGHTKGGGGTVTRTSVPHTALDVFSQMEKPSLGRGNLWGAQGNIIYGPPLPGSERGSCSLISRV